MRITKDLLLTIARNTVAERTFRNRNIVCIYLVGSLTKEEPLLGGTTDIDLVFVHVDEPQQAREIVPVAEEFHLDIWHYEQSIFGQPRKLRTDAWVGSFIAQYALQMYDTQHFFEFTQAGVFAHFFLPSNVLVRAKSFMQPARQRWMNMQLQEKPFSAKGVADYLRCVYEAGNAIACISGSPLVERRFILDLPARTEAIERPGLGSGLIDLFTKSEMPNDQWQSWLDNWERAFNVLNEEQEVPEDFQTARKAYYRQAVEVLSSDNPQAAMWVLLWVWSRMVELLPMRSVEYKEWHEFCAQANLDRSHFQERLAALDAYLEVVEDTLDEYAQLNGLV